MDRVLLRKSAFAHKFGICPGTAGKWLDQGLNGLKKVKIGRTVYADITDFKFSFDSTTSEKPPQKLVESPRIPIKPKESFTTMPPFNSPFGRRD